MRSVYKYVIITEDGKMKLWTPPPGVKRKRKSPTLEELQSIVMGRVEIIKHAHYKIWVNEEGKINGMYPNKGASAFCRADQTLYGPVLIRYR